MKTENRMTWTHRHGSTWVSNQREYEVLGVEDTLDYSRTVSRPVATLSAGEFERLKADNPPGNYYAYGTAAGSPADGLVESIIQGRKTLQMHIGHGSFADVAVAWCATCGRRTVDALAGEDACGVCLAVD